MKDELEKIKAEFAEADKIIFEAEKDLEAFQNFVDNFEKMNEAIHKLEKFYFASDFMPKSNRLRDTGNDEFNSTGEDSIWNLHVWFNLLRIQLLKKLSDEIYFNGQE